MVKTEWHGDTNPMSESNERYARDKANRAKHYGLRAEPIIIHTTKRTLRQVALAAIADASRRLLFKVKVWLGWRFR